MVFFLRWYCVVLAWVHYNCSTRFTIHERFRFCFLCVAVGSNFMQNTAPYLDVQDHIGVHADKWCSLATWSCSPTMNDDELFLNDKYPHSSSSIGLLHFILIVHLILQDVVTNSDGKCLENVISILVYFSVPSKKCVLVISL